ncbi:MAG: putative response regulator, CheY [Ramlibacter sp.]|uniref:response regulator n=1 Tax=Ramlibacter sp. TaxID=1917967 RepID=UPI0026143094|nr:response regulator [Ramlibacter sp.]MDB5752413.1 putative response regulator, CheY [Ramlibacter sp.]
MTVRVFLVEDMPQVHGLLTDLLASVGDLVIAGIVRTEAEARLWLDDHPDGWDLAVIDLVLEQGTGMRLIAHARAEADRSGGRVVVFSDYASDGIRQHCLNLGADAVFSKTSEMQGFLAYCAELDGCAANAP